MKRNIIFQFVLLTIILFVGINNTNAQNEDLNENVLNENVLDESILEENEFDYNVISKNSIHGSFGTLIAAVSLTGYYERVLVQNGVNRNYSTFVRIGYGVIGTVGGGSGYILSQYG